MKHRQFILVVDDDEVNRDLLCEQLEGAGFHVISATDGTEALRLLSERREEIRLVMLDWMMPQLDGIGFLKKIRQFERFKHLPVVMETAKAQKSDVVEAMEAGANYYLIKPYSQEKLLDLVRTALQEASRHY